MSVIAWMVDAILVQGAMSLNVHKTIMINHDAFSSSEIMENNMISVYINKLK